MNGSRPQRASREPREACWQRSRKSSFVVEGVVVVAEALAKRFV